MGQSEKMRTNEKFGLKSLRSRKNLKSLTMGAVRRERYWPFHLHVVAKTASGRIGRRTFRAAGDRAGAGATAGIIFPVEHGDGFGKG